MKQSKTTLIRKSLFVYLILSLVFLPLFTTSVSANEQLPGTVVGVIVDGSGTPIEGAAIKLISEQGGQMAGSTSGADGSFTLYDVPVGSYKLKAFTSNATNQAVQVDVQSGAMTDLGNVWLNVSVGTIAGTVTHQSSGTGLSNVRVEIYTSSTDTYVTDSFTDSNGSYNTQVEPGSYKVVVYGGPQPTEQSVTVEAGQTSSADLQLNVTAITGRVVDEFGNPIWAEVHTTQGNTTYSGQDGTYLIFTTEGSQAIRAFDENQFKMGSTWIESLSAGQLYTASDITINETASTISGYILSSGNQNYYGEILLLDQGDNVVDRTFPRQGGEYKFIVYADTYKVKLGSIVQEITVEQGQSVKDVNFDAAAVSFTVSGRVTSESTGEGIMGIWIDVVDNSGQSVNGASTDSQGYYKIEGVHQGGYSFIARLGNQQSEQHINVTSDVTDVNFNVNITAITGVVTDNEGTPLANAEVRIMSNNFYQSTWTNDNGQYIAVLFNGNTYNIKASHNQFYYTTQVTVQNSQIAVADLPLVYAGGTLEGTLTNEVSGEPLKNTWISVYSDMEGTQLYDSFAVNDGDFSTVLAPGYYMVRAHVGDKNLDQFNIEIAEGVTTYVSFSTTVTEITGTVHDSEGNPISYADVAIEGEDRDNQGKWHTNTDEFGNYSMYVRAGNYTVTAMKNMLQGRMSGVYAIENETTYVDIELTTQVSRVYGQVRNVNTQQGISNATITIFNESNEQVERTFADESGNYEFYAPAGDYSMVIAVNQDFIIYNGSITIPDTGDKFDFELTVTTISGTVRDQQGNPVSFANVGAYNIDFETSTQTREDGSFILYVPAGVYTLEAYYNDLVGKQTEMYVSEGANISYDIYLNERSRTPDIDDINVSNKPGNSKDRIIVENLQVGDVVYVYAGDIQNPTLIETSNPVAEGSDRVTIYATNLSREASIVYMIVKSTDKAESKPVAVFSPGEPSDALYEEFIRVTNNPEGTDDVIEVGQVYVGDIIKVYDRRGRLIGSSQPVEEGQELATIYIPQIGATQGMLFITRTSSELSESKVTPVNYGVEKSTPLTVDQVTVTNNSANVKDTVVVSGLNPGDKVIAYSDSDATMKFGSGQVAGGQSSVTLSGTLEPIAEDAETGTIYVAVLRKGLSESDTIAVEYKDEAPAPIDASKVSVTNNMRGTKDVITIDVFELRVGDTINVYSPTAKLGSTKVTEGQLKAEIKLDQLGRVAGTIFVTIARKGLESERTTVSYLAEKSAPIAANQVIIKNFVGAKDTIEVKDTYVVNDVITVYDATGLSVLGTFKVRTVSPSITMELSLPGNSDKVKVSITRYENRTPLIESDKVDVNYAPEPIAANKVLITNNPNGAEDVVRIALDPVTFKKNDIIKIYAKESDTSEKAKQTITGNITAGQILEIKQKDLLEKMGGSVYVTIVRGSTETIKSKVDYIAEKSLPLDVKQIVIVNNVIGTNDSIDFSGINAGDKIRVYRDASPTAAYEITVPPGKTSFKLEIDQIGETAGTFYFTITRVGQPESDRIAVTFADEPPAALAAYVVTIKNNKAPKKDEIKVNPSSLKVGDKLMVYSSLTGTAKVVEIEIKSTAQAITVSVNELGKTAGSIYISVVRNGLESARTKFNYLKES